MFVSREKGKGEREAKRIKTGSVQLCQSRIVDGLAKPGKKALKVEKKNFIILWNTKRRIGTNRESTRCMGDVRKSRTGKTFPPREKIGGEQGGVCRFWSATFKAREKKGRNINGNLL